MQWGDFSNQHCTSEILGKVQPSLSFSGSLSKFLAVYYLGFKKCALVLHLALQQLVQNVSISAENTKSCNLAWNLIKKIKTMLSYGSRKPKRLYPRLKFILVGDDQYIYDMWAHISDVNNHCARKSLKCCHPLSFSLVKPQDYPSSGILFMPQCGIGIGA